MWKNKRCLLTAVVAFAAAELTLGILVQTLSGRAVMWVSFGAVILACAFFALFFERSPHWGFTQLALVCTVCADYFLVVHPEQPQFAAMLFFSVTQFAYGARLCLEEAGRTRRTVQLAVRGGVSLLAVLLTLLVLGKGADKVALVSLFYFANLLLNVVLAFLSRERNWLFATGLLLFVFCDVFVGLSLIEGYLPLAKESLLYRLAHPGFNLAWVFYVPSQALLALSLLPRKWREIKE